MWQTPMAPGEFGKRAQEALSRTIAVGLNNMAIQDFAMVGFHCFMWLRVMMAPDTLDATVARSGCFGLLATSLVTLVLTRGELMGPGPARAAVYRIGMLIPMVGSYFTLKWLLPALQPRLLDRELLRFDELVFGFTPAHYLDRFVSHATVEWFSLFYYSYFYLIGFYVLTSMVLDTGRRLKEVTFGSMAIVAIGHCTYIAVPGVGPYIVYPFQNELVGGFFWRQVTNAVAAAGAQLDIFPSLHTAFPVFFTLHAYRHRGQRPFGYLWVPTAFVAVNIVAATLFLRWHYGVDVIAGLCLAVFVQRLAIRVAIREERSEHVATRQEVWEPIG
jgi:hypothetical protein